MLITVICPRQLGQTSVVGGVLMRTLRLTMTVLSGATNGGHSNRSAIEVELKGRSRWERGSVKSIMGALASEVEAILDHAARL